MKIQIFVEHDIIIRHFLLSGVLKKLEEHNEVQYILPKDSRVKTDIPSLNLRNYRVVDVNRKRISQLRDLAKVQTIYIAKKKKKFQFVERIWEGVLTKSHVRRLKVKSHPLIFPFYKKFKLKQLGKSENLAQIICDFAPDILIHPTVLDGLFIADLCSTSKELKIPLIVLMNSWDNPSTKAMVVGLPDHLVVWGPQTKQHAMDFMAMPENKISCFGSAQFDVYKLKPTKSRNDICQLMGVPAEKKLIVYAGSSKSINEIDHLLTLEKEIEEGKLENCHIVFRPHPWRAPAPNEPDFHSLNWKHVSIDPFMAPYFKSTKDVKMNLTDYMDTHNILSACDLLISNVSTILLEGAMHFKPVICMVSDADLAQSDFLRVILNALFFNELLEKMDIPRCKEHKQISSIITSELKLAEAPRYVSERKNLIDYFVNTDQELYSQKLEKLIPEIIKNYR